MNIDDFTKGARAKAEDLTGPPIAGETSWDYRWLFEAGAEWARTHLATQEPTDAESLLDTDAGLALANAAWKEGASMMLRSVNYHEDGPWEKPESPYSAPLLARIAARRDEGSTP